MSSFKSAVVIKLDDVVGDSLLTPLHVDLAIGHCGVLIVSDTRMENELKRMQHVEIKMVGEPASA